MAVRAFTPPTGTILRSVPQNLLKRHTINIEKKVLPDITQSAPRLPPPTPPEASEPAVVGGAAQVLEQISEVRDPLEAVLSRSWQRKPTKPSLAAAVQPLAPAAEKAEHTHQVLEWVGEVQDPLEAVLSRSWRGRPAKPPLAAAPPQPAGEKVDHTRQDDALDAAVEDAAKKEELVEARAAEAQGAAVARAGEKPDCISLKHRGALRRRASCPTLTIATSFPDEVNAHKAAEAALFRDMPTSGSRLATEAYTQPVREVPHHADQLVREGEMIVRQRPAVQSPECDGPGGRCASRPGTAASCEGAGDAEPPVRAPQRRYSFLFEDLEENIASPDWMPPKQRRGCCKISISEVLSPGSQPGEIARFQGMVKKLEILVNQTVVRINGHLGVIRRHLSESPDMFDNPTNRAKLDALNYMLAVANYRLSKWLHQLASEKHPMPKKPTRRDDGPCSKDLLAEVSFACSRMELVASVLTPMMQRIVSDASTERFPAGPGSVLPVGFRDPIKAAEERGMTNIKELDGLPLHLEHALQLSNFLAHSPLQIKSVGTTADVMVAVGRFKGALMRRASAPTPDLAPFGA